MKLNEIKESGWYWYSSNQLQDKPTIVEVKISRSDNTVNRAMSKNGHWKDHSSFSGNFLEKIEYSTVIEKFDWNEYYTKEYGEPEYSGEISSKERKHTMNSLSFNYYVKPDRYVVRQDQTIGKDTTIKTMEIESSIIYMMARFIKTTFKKNND